MLIDLLHEQGVPAGPEKMTMWTHVAEHLQTGRSADAISQHFEIMSSGMRQKSVSGWGRGRD